MRAVPAFWVASVAAAAAGSGRAAGEIALLVVCGAVILAAAAVALRRGLHRGSHPRAVLLGLRRACRPAAARDSAATPDGVDTEPAAFATGALAPAGPHDPAEQNDAGSRGRSPRARVVASAAAVVLLAVAVGTAVILAGGARNPASRPSVVAGPIGPGLAQAPQAGTSDPASKVPGKHPGNGPAGNRPGSTASPKSGGPGSSGSGSGPGPTPSSSPARSSPPPAPSIVLPSGTVQLHESGDDVYTGSFPVTALNGSVHYTVSVPSGESGDYFIEVEDNGTGTVTPTTSLSVVLSVTAFTSSGPPPYVVLTPGGTVQFALSS